MKGGQRVCVICKKLKPISQYSWRNIKNGIRHGFCKECHIAYRRSHYLANKEKYIKKAKSWNEKQTKILRKFMFEYLVTHPCVDCGETDLRVLEFDHQRNKYMDVSAMVRGCYSINAVKKEIEKCVVRCANCHKKKTFVDRHYWRAKMGAW